MKKFCFRSQRKLKLFLILDSYPYLWRIKGNLDINMSWHYYPLTAADDYAIRWFERRFWGCSVRPVRKFSERCQSFSVNNRFCYNSFFLCNINDSKFLYFGTYKLIFLNFPFQSLDGSVLSKSYCSAMHPFRLTIPMIRIIGIVWRNGCIALQYDLLNTEPSRDWNGKLRQINL